MDKNIQLFLTETTNKFWDYFLIAILIFYVAFSSISNISILIPAVKFSAIIFVYIFFKFSKNNQFYIVHEFRKIKFFLILILISGISLFYTENFNYGIFKFFNITANLPILIFLSFYFKDISNKNIGLIAQRIFQVL